MPDFIWISKERNGCLHLHTRNKLWGVFTRKERWGLSRRGWALSCVIVFSGLLLLLWLVHPFLAVTHRVGGNVLVLEGWVHQFGIVAAVGEFKTGAYPKIYST